MTPGHRPTEPSNPRSLRQTLWVVGIVAVLVLLYWKASGGNDANEISTHRLIVAECWNNIARQAPTPLTPQEQRDACQRMERGFAQMYGSGF